MSFSIANIVTEKSSHEDKLGNHKEVVGPMKPCGTAIAKSPMKDFGKGKTR